MATRRIPTTNLRFDVLEPRETPAGTPVIDFEAGFTADQLPGGVPAGYIEGDLLLTDGPYQSRAVFDAKPVDVRAFHTSFVFGVTGGSHARGDGFTFALTGDGRRAAETAGGAAGGGLGYAGLTESVAIKFDLTDNDGEGPNSVGLVTGGAAPTTPSVSLDGTGLNLHAGHAIRADIGYDGTTLTLTLTDGLAPDRTWTHDFVVDIPAAVGSPTGYAGFTAGTGELFARLSIDSWMYTEGVPETPANRPPVISTPAWASWGSPGAVVLAAAATDDGGSTNLTYTWEVESAPAGAAPEIRPMDRQSATVLLDRGGRHTFRVTVRDAQGLEATSTVHYSDPLHVTNFELTAGTETIRAGDTVQLETLVVDAAGHRTAENLAPLWQVVSGPGTIDRFGRYAAPLDASGPVTIEATIPAFVVRYFTTRTARITFTVLGGFEGMDLARNGSAQVSGGRLRLTDGPHQAASAFAQNPVDIRGFRTSFWFRVGDQLAYRYGDGLTFILQNAGLEALGAAGGGLGYEGIAQSVAIKFDLVDNAGEGPQSVGVYTGGAAPTTPADRLPAPPPGQGNGGLLLNRGHVFRADLIYADGKLGLQLRDTVTGHGFGRTYAVDIPAAVGGPTAYAGFTAGTGELSAPIDILKWSFAPANEPPPDGDGPPAVRVDVGVGAGTIATVAGNGSWSYSGDGGPAASAALASPFEAVLDASGNLFIVEYSNQRVRRVDAATGVITTVAGNGTYGFAGDGGPATSASLGYPTGVAVDAAGHVYIADRDNQRIRRVDAGTGIITTVAGTGAETYSGDGGPAADAALFRPTDVAVDADGNLFIADTYNNRIRKVDAATGIITTVAGAGTYGFAGDGGPATAATFRNPVALAVDAAGNLFIADVDSMRIRKVDAATGLITTVVGNGATGFAGDGGPAIDASLFAPSGVAVDAAGNLYVADTFNHRVRRVDAGTGVIATVAGTGMFGYGGDGGPADAAALAYPNGVAVDGAGNLLIADRHNNRVRKVAVGTVRTGNPAIYTFTITNTSLASTDPVTITSIVDDVLGDLTAAARAENGGGPIVLAPGESFTFSATSPALDPGVVVNEVNVTARDDENSIATASDTATVTVL
jgi:sugar lactone lactonase YvrE